ncbi:epigen [Cyclopterus lumpus]|uniref:Epithelial mitogen homolog (mouse) n=1 Tax=Cyclopterus lumpus TaxID=8103 RepID=A0A8C3A1F2_CYCLU|nr:epigen [Cyclopterus lumpus]
MFTQRQAHADKALLSAMAALLLLTTTGQSAMSTNSLPTAATPALSAPSLTTQLGNGSMEEPQVLPSHRSCRSEHEHFCDNGGECMYPQDSDEPACICKSSYSGRRCLFLNDRAYTLPELEQLIGITFGVAVLIIVLAFISYCLAYRRCIKSAPFKKLALSESSV